MTITPTPVEPPGIHGDDFDPPFPTGTIAEPTPTPHDPVFDIALPLRPLDKPSRRTTARKSRWKPPAEAPVEHHALYRLYNEDGVLLYIGETNSPVERYIEHRETKEWWPEVAHHSIEWFKDGREKTQEREKAAIRDEWPLYNVAHQPRGDGTYYVPSYVVERIFGAIERAVVKIKAEGDLMLSGRIARLVQDEFRPDGDGMWGEIGFPFGEWPRPESLDLDSVLDAMGPFRPDIDNSMRDPKPRKRLAEHCRSATGSSGFGRKCGATLRRDGACRHAGHHYVEDAREVEAIREMLAAEQPPSPTDAVDGA